MSRFVKITKVDDDYVVDPDAAGAKDEQTKSVTYETNGVYTVTPDEDKVLSSVSVTVNVPLALSTPYALLYGINYDSRYIVSVASNTILNTFLDTTYCNGICYSNYLGRIVACCSNSRVAVSDDNGCTYTMYTVPTTFVAVTYSEDLHMFVAAGSYDFYTSTDGITWTACDTSINNVYKIIYAGGKFIAIGNSYFCSYYSTDGVAWEAITDTLKGTDIAYSDDLGIFIVLDVSNANHYYTSQDGINWTSVSITSSGSYNLQSIAWSPDLGKFVIACMESSTIFVSDDGTTWTAVATGVSQLGDNYVVWIASENKFYMFGASNYYSLDGTTWTLDSSLLQKIKGVDKIAVI